MKKLMIGLCILSGFMVGFHAVALLSSTPKPQEAETYIVHDKQELQAALGVAKGGDTVQVMGEWYDSLQFGKLVYPDGNPLLVEGAGCTLKHGLSVMDSHNITFTRFHIKGGTGTAGAELNDSYPDIGLRNITFDKFIIEPPAGPRGIFAGGHNMRGIKIKNTIIVGPIGGTHGIYLSGGAFDDTYGPIMDVVIRGCTIELQPGARNGIQVNGYYVGGKIINNLIRHAHLNAITLIGSQDYDVSNNVGYGCERGTFIVVYDYASHWGPYYNYFRTQEDIDLFNSRHKPCQNIHIHHNTMLVGPKAFCNWPGNNEDPTKNHPVILINNAVNSGFLMWVPNEPPATGGENVQHPGWDYPTKNIWVQKNICWSPNLNMIDIYHEHEATETSVTGNMFWSTKEGTPTISYSNKLKVLTDNMILDPGFIPPRYDYVDLTTQPNYDWTTFQTQFDAFSMPGYRRGIGKKFPMPVLGQPHRADPYMIRMMENADPYEDR